MMTEIMLVEGVTDIQLISYYLQSDKAKVGTFFSVRYPKNAMRPFGIFISKIDWAKSESLKELFLPFKSLGEEKDCNIKA